MVNPVNTEQTLIVILGNKQTFFRLMDLASESGTGHAMEFTISAYDRVLADEADRLSAVEGRRLIETLSLENLQRNGLLNYLDQKLGRFRLKGFVLSMLRHLDRRRLRELSLADLNQLVIQLDECYNLVSDYRLAWIPGDPAYSEMVQAVYDTFQHAASSLGDNITALRGKADTLSSVVDSADTANFAQAEQVRRALDSILQIHKRHVTPTLQFLNEHGGWARSKILVGGELAEQTREGPMGRVRDIIQRFDQHGKDEHVSALQRIHFHILSYAQEAHEIATSMEIYIRFARQERQRYDCAEKMFNRLLAAAQEKHTGSQRDFRVPRTHAVWSAGRELGNLKVFVRAQSANLNWPNEEGLSEFSEALRVHAVSEALRPDGRFTEVVTSARDTNGRKRRLRIRRLVKAIKDFDLSNAQDDVFLGLHRHLINRLDDYRLDMLIDSVELLKAKGRMEVVSYTRVDKIDYGGKRLRYRPWRLVPVGLSAKQNISRNAQ
ncbi:hypothetical protein [uncultured Alcanivorax sp.]|uniref:hypothetical protein n=1 Tax=uncultured Alcanivorax sp. TaxID=191215 RepID=UPI0025F007F4|nr:hypothetical protein [uncultured Alcanivorax sp.]